VVVPPVPPLVVPVVPPRLCSRLWCGSRYRARASRISLTSIETHIEIKIDAAMVGPVRNGRGNGQEGGAGDDDVVHHIGGWKE
jgi:hypothetical protein